MEVHRSGDAAERRLACQTSLAAVIDERGAGHVAAETGEEVTVEHDHLVESGVDRVDRFGKSIEAGIDRLDICANRSQFSLKTDLPAA